MTEEEKFPATLSTPSTIHLKIEDDSDFFSSTSTDSHSTPLQR